jgi:hypothetical protein
MWDPGRRFPRDFNAPNAMAPLRTKVMPSVTPLLGYSKATGDRIRLSGSGILVKRRGGTALITAAHVIKEYHLLRAEERDVQLFAVGAEGQVRTPVGQWEVEYASDKDVDIAALHVPRRLKPGRLGLTPWSGRITPRRPVEEDDLAYAIGFPGAARIDLGGRGVLGYAGVLEFVVSSSERHFVMAPADGPRTFHPASHIAAVAAPIERVGGMSGGPVFVFSAPRVLMISDMHDPPTQWMDVMPEWELAGVVYEGGPGINEAWLFAAHTHHLAL